MAQEGAGTTTLPRVAIHTNQGEIVLELYADKAPKSVENFLAYVRDGFYDGTIFHRVIKKFMVQGGGYTADFAEKDAGDPIENEADNGLGNERGTVAMARTNDPHSATAQFFINVVDNGFLDHKSTQSDQSWGYAVFGRVAEGMDVVDRMEAAATGAAGPFSSDVPKDTLLIESAEILAD